MRKLSYSVPVAKLRSFTHLAAKTRNVTRWSSTFDMVERYIEIKQHLREVQLNNVDIVLPTRQQDEVLSKLYGDLVALNKVTLDLQSESTRLRDVRACFDFLLDIYPEMASQISANGEIVQYPEFETAVVKVQMGNISALTPAERRSVAHLQSGGPSGDGEDDERLSLFERAVKRQKAEQLNGYLTWIFYYLRQTCVNASFLVRNML
ncbi:hypothetical protein AeRB84_012396 [Aphanomyces euteiches]|nr:hypothetical protein AeRB84_012396 [Aphanomyces euteiches]